MGTSRPQQPSGLPESSSSGRLDSWKEIAAYLKRDERTVRRWEQEGLPVRRHMHKKQPSIYAFKAEIDAWWNNGRQRLEPAERIGTAAEVAVSARGRPQRRAVWLAFIAGAFLVAFLIGFDVGGLRQRVLGRPDPGTIHSLAVLPLENLSRDPEQEYFADGMTDELITELAQISSLRVISRTSVMHYKTTAKTAPEIAKELNVEAVLEGSVVRSDNRVRITAQLIEARADRHLWAGSYEGESRDALAMQDSVAREVVKQIRLRLTVEEQARLNRARSVNPKAHEAYLRGLFYWNKRNRTGLEKAIEYYQRAVDVDPNYALPYAGLAQCYIPLTYFGYLRGIDAQPQVNAALQKGTRT